MAILLFWILLAVLVGVYAANKGRSGAGFFFLSLLLSPLVGFLIALLSKPNREAAAQKSGLKKCPRCAEYVQPEAAVCRFCGHEFSPSPAVFQHKSGFCECGNPAPVGQMCSACIRARSGTHPTVR